ncbi:glycosyltransferase family 4 protein [Sphingomonas cavernae]|uniref:Glycosyltransferase family 1 protein n=1 Tax=Sphingomonas cavernae TaxID=2320861 RepID=A0A418WQW3_9SPHN|nr:glycosyltransferase family 4 protein [Sphingomonas cavernae]RJF93654.1 glycosyltransferase family 1 protein [Sphingomonas cavernae]
MPFTQAVLDWSDGVLSAPTGLGDWVADYPVTICFPFVGDVIGGNHISVLGLIKHLDPSRFIPLVVLHDVDGPVAKLYREAGVGFVQDPGRGRLVHGRRVRGSALMGLLPDLPARMRFLKQHRVAIVHTNDGRCHAAWGLAARLAGAKLLWHHRGNPTAAGLRAAPWLAHQIVAVSRFAAPSYRRRPDAVRVIFSPFDTAISEDRCARRAALIDELDMAPDVRLVGFFGALMDRKRPLLFVDAIAELQRLRPDIRFMGLMFGEPHEGAEIHVPERARAAGIGDSIRLMGFRRPGAGWIAACDLLMVPAVEEPLGRTLVEAMLVGTPVVATDSGGNREAIEHGRTGLIVRAEDAEALARGAERILADAALRKRLTAAAAAHAREHFGATRHASRIMAIYEQLMSRAKGKQNPGRSARSTASVEAM